jgi:hypothetical protein
MYARRVVVVARRPSDAAAHLAAHPVDGQRFLNAWLCRGRRLQQGRIHQQPSLYAPLNRGMRLRRAQPQLLRQPGIRPTLFIPSHQLEGNEKVLGFELHLFCICDSRI